MRSPLTGIVFAIELTHDVNMMLPLLIAVTVAHAFTVRTLRRSILTEKVSRRGYHLTREYSIDPLEILFVREVVRTSIVALSASMTLEEARAVVAGTLRPRRRQRLYPVVAHDQRPLGVVTRSHLEHSIQTAPRSMRIDAVAHSLPVVAYPDEPLRAVVHRLDRTDSFSRGRARRDPSTRGNDQPVRPARRTHADARRRAPTRTRVFAGVGVQKYCVKCAVDPRGLTAEDHSKLARGRRHT